ncbi:MAG: hypothetical protein J4432_04890 [DPANN group archaeon]|nr:hypothetical protein [DPANN group archaeon]
MQAKRARIIPQGNERTTLEEYVLIFITIVILLLLTVVILTFPTIGS